MSLAWLKPFGDLAKASDSLTLKHCLQDVIGLSAVDFAGLLYLLAAIISQRLLVVVGYLVVIRYSHYNAGNSTMVSTCSEYHYPIMII